MIITVLADIKKIDIQKMTGGCSFDDKFDSADEYQKITAKASFLREEVLAHINEAKNERVRKERFCAYYLLRAATRKIFGADPQIEWSANGKPRYVGENIRFNLSHCGDLVAVTVSDSDQVGVDVEGLIDEERAARLESRFFSELSFSERKLDVKYIFCRFSEDGSCDFTNFVQSEKMGEMTVDKEEITLSYASHSDCFTAGWTLYEASLKCDGGGFTSLPCLGMILLETKADIQKISLGSQIFYVATTAS